MSHRHFGSGQPCLQATGLRAGYGALTVLHGVDLELSQGKITFVQGRNGAGKTTLIHALIGHLTATGGRISLDGKDITGWPTHRRATAGIGVVAQGRRLFPTLTAAEHLAITRAPKPAQHAVLDRFPALRTRLNHRPAQLSGGEQQMLAIARAILSRPRILLLDEPSEGLAGSVVDQLTKLMTDLARDNIAVLVTEHNKNLADIADQHLVMARGRLADAT